MQHAQNASIKKHISGQVRPKLVMKQRHVSINAPSASMFGQSIGEFLGQYVFNHNSS